MSILIFVFSIILCITLTILGLFLGHIIFFESIILSVISYNVCTQLLGIHGAFSLLISIAVFIVFILLQKTKFGFWIISGLMSVAWGLLPAVFVYDMTNSDMIWTYVIWGLSTIIVLYLHLVSRARLE